MTRSFFDLTKGTPNLVRYLSIAAFVLYFVISEMFWESCTQKTPLATQFLSVSETTDSAIVSDVDFNPLGTNFLSASYDRQMKIWDVETGACTGRFSTGKIPHVVKFYPSEPHIFLAGMSDKKIVQFDQRSGEMVSKSHFFRIE